MNTDQMENWSSRENENAYEQDWEEQTFDGGANTSDEADEPPKDPGKGKEDTKTDGKKGKLVPILAAAAAVVALLVLRPWGWFQAGSEEPDPEQHLSQVQTTAPTITPTQAPVVPDTEPTEPVETTAPVETTVPPTEPVVYENPFEDIDETAVYYEPVMWAFHNGIINGTSETTFSPDSPLMRGQMVTMLWRAAGKPEPVGTVSPFEDVPQDSVFFKAVMWAYENGIAGGSDATHFGTEQVCNRAQVITFLYRAVGSPATTLDSIPCTDVEPGTFYYDAVVWAYENGISSGVSATEFGITVICTRSQIATLLYRAYNN